MYKKLLSSILTASMLMSYSAAFASDDNVNQNTSQKTHLNAIKENIKNKLPIKSAETVAQAPVENVLIPKKLEESMKASISHIYGKEQVDVIYPKIVKIIEKAKSERNPYRMTSIELLIGIKMKLSTCSILISLVWMAAGNLQLSKQQSVCLIISKI